MTQTEPIPTIDGTFVATFSDRGLASLDFPANRPGSKSSEPRSSRPPGAGGRAAGRELQRWVRLTGRALQAVLRGRKPAALPPLDLSAGTAFQRKVWAALLRIEPGRTRTYAELAREIGHPNAFRAAGGACGSNPIPVLVPCHRVLAANRRLGGFSGGLDWKRRLLDREGVQVAEQSRRRCA